MCNPFHEQMAVDAVTRIPPCQANKAALILLNARGDAALNRLKPDYSELEPLEIRETAFVANRTDLLIQMLDMADSEELNEAGAKLAEQNPQHREIHDALQDAGVLRYGRPEALGDLLRLIAIALSQEPDEERTPSEILRDEASVLELAGANSEQFLDDLAAALAKARNRDQSLQLEDVLAVETTIAKVLGRNAYSAEERANHISSARGGTAEPGVDELASEAERRIEAGEDPMQVLQEISAKLLNELGREAGFIVDAVEVEVEGENEQLDIEEILREISELPETDEKKKD